MGIFQVEIEIVVDELKFFLSSFVSIIIEIFFKNLNVFSVVKFQYDFLNTGKFHPDKVLTLRYKGVNLFVPNISYDFVIIYLDLVTDDQTLKVLNNLSILSTKLHWQFHRVIAMQKPKTNHLILLSRVKADCFSWMVVPSRG